MSVATGSQPEFSKPRGLDFACNACGRDCNAAEYGSSALGEALQSWELGSFDSLVRLQPDFYGDPRLLVVAILRQIFKLWGDLRFPSKAIAQTLTKLQKYQPKVIGLDLYRDLPQPPGNQELLTQLKAPNVVGIDKLSDSDSPGVPAPPGCTGIESVLTTWCSMVTALCAAICFQSPKPSRRLLSRFLCKWLCCISKTECSRKIAVFIPTKSTGKRQNLCL